MVGGNFQVQFAGVPGVTYGLEYKTNLTDSTWLWRANVTAPSNGIIPFADPIPEGVGSRFYRTVYPPYLGTYPPP